MGTLGCMISGRWKTLLNRRSFVICNSHRSVGSLGGRLQYVLRTARKVEIAMSLCSIQCLLFTFQVCISLKERSSEYVEL